MQVHIRKAGNLASQILRVQLSQPFGLLVDALAAGNAQRLVYDKLPLLTGLLAGPKLRGVRSLRVHKGHYVNEEREYKLNKKPGIMVPRGSS